MANEKFQDNFERIERFYKNILENCLQANVEKVDKAKGRQEERAEKKKYFERLKREGNLDELRKNKKTVQNECDFDKQVASLDLDGELNLFFSDL